MKRIGIVPTIILLLPLTSFAYTSGTCDRECLLSLMKDYLAALVAHDPSAVPFNQYVKFTENTAEIPVGYGLWETASGGPSEFQIYAADPVNQQVAALVMMKENNNQDILLGVRLALKRGKIAEAEHHVVQRDEIHLENLIKPRPGLVEDISPEDRTPRDQMLDIGLSYYDAPSLKKEGAAFSRTAPPLDSLLYATQFPAGAAPRPPPMPPPASSRFSLSSSPESVPVQDMLKSWPLTLRT